MPKSTPRTRRIKKQIDRAFAGTKKAIKKAGPLPKPPMEPVDVTDK